MKTFVASAKTVESRWHVIDANGQVLGTMLAPAQTTVQDLVVGFPFAPSEVEVQPRYRVAFDFAQVERMMGRVQSKPRPLPASAVSTGRVPRATSGRARA